MNDQVWFQAAEMHKFNTEQFEFLILREIKQFAAKSHDDRQYQLIDLMSELFDQYISIPMMLCASTRFDLNKSTLYIWVRVEL